MKFLGLLLLWNISCFGQIFDYSKDKPLHIDISSEYNRIVFPHLKITEVFGNGLKFDAIAFSVTNEMLFIPKSRIGETLEVGIVSNTGLVQEMVLKTQDIAPQIIEINMPLPHQLLGVKEKTQEEEAEDFLRRILSNKVQFNPIKSMYLKNIKIIGNFIEKQFIANLVEGDKDFTKIFPSAIKVQTIFSQGEKSQAIVITNIK